jgi:hypothetical protein
VIAILGQGIAGTAIALRLLEKEIPFVIYDNHHKDSSSMVAAGLWNPIVFRRVNKSWMAEEFIQDLESFYPELEKKLNSKFFVPRPVWRIHGSKQELDNWYEKNQLPGFSPYLFNPPHKLQSRFGITPEYGEGEVRHAGYLDLPVFLAEARKHFETTSHFVSTELPLCPSKDDLSQLLPDEDQVSKIIDCRGNRSAQSPWWSYLPFGLTKGEVLTIRCKGLELKETFNAGFFVLPLGRDLYRVGATFNWDDKSYSPTEEGRKQLCEKFEGYFDAEYEIIEHKAGIRPTVQDRRPIMGSHPSEKDLFLFNGLGTKGVMLAPYLSKHFLSHFLDRKSLMREVDIRRFDKLIGSENPQINYPTP